MASYPSQIILIKGNIQLVRYPFNDFDGALSWIDKWENMDGEEVDKETAKRETLRQWHDDNIRVLQLHKERFETKIEALEADIRRSEQLKASIPEYKQETQMGVPVQSLQAVATSETRQCGPHQTRGHLEVSDGFTSIRRESVLRN